MSTKKIDDEMEFYWNELINMRRLRRRILMCMKSKTGESEMLEKVLEFLNDLMHSAEMVMNSTGHNRKCMKNDWLRMEFERAYALHCILDFLYEYIHETDDEVIKEINNARLTWLSEYIDGVEDEYVAIWRIADECEHRENNLLWSMISFLGKANTLQEINRKYYACKCILGEM